MVATAFALALSVLAASAAAADPTEACSLGSPGCDAEMQEDDESANALRMSLLQVQRSSLGDAEVADASSNLDNHQCVDFPCSGSNYDNRRKCECGNYGYTYNVGRGSWNARCGQSAQCWCCKSGGWSNPRRRRGGWSNPRRRRGGWSNPRRRRGGRSGNYRIFSGYQCQNGYHPIEDRNECQNAARQVSNNNLHVDTNVPSSNQNPRYCYIYGSPGRYTNLYYNERGVTSGSWSSRNVICKQGYSSLAQDASQEDAEEAELEDKKADLTADLDAIDAELALIDLSQNSSLQEESGACPMTAGSCSVFGCDKSRGSTQCKNGKCICSSHSSCALNGVCVPLGACSTKTPGTCSWGSCKKSRGPTNCKSSKCVCKEGYCSVNGVCVSQRDTGGTCSWGSCSTSRGATKCIDKKCICLAGYASGGKCH